MSAADRDRLPTVPAPGEGVATPDAGAATPDAGAAAPAGPALTGEILDGADGGTPADAPGGDPFPRDAFVRLVGHLPRYLRLAWGLAGEPRLPLSRRAGVLAAAAYLASPIDVVPGIIPVVGQVDDLAVTLLALRAALRALDPETRQRQLAAAGLAPTDLDDDLRTLGTIAAWLARRGIAVGRRLAMLAAAASVAAARVGARAVRRGAPVVVRGGARAGRATGGALLRGAVRGRDVLASRLRRP